MNNFDDELTRYFLEHQSAIQAFIARRIPHSRDAADLTQDVFVKLWNVRAMICEQTIKSLVFTTTQNIVFDHLRRYQRWQRREDYLAHHCSTTSDSTNETVNARNLAETELNIVAAMPTKRRIIYIATRYDEKDLGDIATEMGISRRTAETHLYLARKEVRVTLRRCI